MCPQLECCDGLAQQATQCSAHASCSGLLGECCPTTDGVFLECCNGGGDSSLVTRECSANTECAALGLEGSCCPPDFGSKNLGCCHGQQAVSTPAIGQLCSENSQCAAIGLEGICCPTAQGLELHCCDSSNPSSQSRTATPVNPPITIKYVTGAPITTPKPSSPPTLAPTSSPVVILAPVEVTTSEQSNQNSEQDGNQSSQLSEEVADGDDSRSSVNQLVAQQASSSVRRSGNILQSVGVVMSVAFACLL
mmetsp:Transcript_7859/g.18939  ORF Transcript_7859/g.18939 Transcript_7859/m.18939 type:complete len:250 (+) Transcript_7859:43-792(+)